MPEEKPKRKWEDYGLLGGMILLLLIALLCYLGILCPKPTCPQGMYRCDLCEGGCCLPGGVCPCPPGMSLCPPALNCPSGCCIGDECVIGERSLYNPDQFWTAPNGSTFCPSGIDCASGVCVGSCCIFECRPEIAATCSPSVNENATGGCTADGATCIYRCDRPECMGCCDQFGNCIGTGKVCMPHYSSCATNESCCSGICKDNACYCIQGGTGCNTSAQCCSLKCVIPEGEQTGKCGYDCGAIDCTKCVNGSCGGTGQKNCSGDAQCAGGVCDPDWGCVFCPAGSHWDSVKKCCVFDDNPSMCIPSCPAGMEYNVAKGMCCVIEDPTKCCPVGAFYDKDRDACCLISDPTKCCPVGSIWDEAKKCCVTAAGNCIYNCSAIDCSKCINDSCGGTGQVVCISDEDCSGLECDPMKGCILGGCGAIDCSKCINDSCGGTGGISCTPVDESTKCAGLICDPLKGCSYPFDCGEIDCTKCDPATSSCGGTEQISCMGDEDCAGLECDPMIGCGLPSACTSNAQCQICTNFLCGGIPGSRTCVSNDDCATATCSPNGICDGSCVLRPDACKKCSIVKVPIYCYSCQCSGWPRRCKTCCVYENRGTCSGIPGSRSCNNDSDCADSVCLQSGICDGTVTPPPSSCPYSCSDSPGCKVACGADGKCPSGQACCQNDDACKYCISLKCGGIGPRTCSTDIACAGSKCVDGKCDGITETIPPGVCTVSNRPEGQQCNDTYCCAPGLICFKPNPAATQGTCCSGGAWACYTACSATEPCPTGYTCGVDGRCK